MRLCLVTVSLLMAAFLVQATALADPGGPNLQQPIAVVCSDGSTATLNPGTSTNRGRVAWDSNSTSVFVTSYLAFTNGAETDVAFDSKQGLKSVITCTGDAGNGFTVISKGFFTPR